MCSLFILNFTKIIGGFLAKYIVKINSENLVFPVNLFS